jgi:hypothetical protein
MTHVAWDGHADVIIDGTLVTPAPTAAMAGPQGYIEHTLHDGTTARTYGHVRFRIVEDLGVQVTETVRAHEGH